MSASFPASQKTFTRQTDGVDYPKATDVNQTYDEIEAIEAWLLALLINGWTPANQTWTYASATTITVPSGAASIYQVGDKIMLTQTTVKYFYIVAVADTLLTVTGGTDYTLANAAITANYYSHASSPVGFPTWFNYTPTLTWTAGTAPTNPTGNINQFCINGRTVTINIMQSGYTAGATVTKVTITMPVTPVTNASANGIINTGSSQNNSYAYLAASLGNIYCTSVSATAMQFSTTYQI
jgi:hypothetical protein